jgi:hypothetical protein
MPWDSEDWRPFEPTGAARESHRPPHVEALQELLLRLPDHAHRLAAHLERPAPGLAPFLDEHFRRVVRFGVPPRGLTQFQGSFDLVVAVDALGGASPEALARVHAALAEGGLLVGTAVATASGDDPLELRLARGLPARVHEVELQYYLARAGFQGLRIRRIAADLCFAERILFMAVRRALN